MRRNKSRRVSKKKKKTEKKAVQKTSKSTTLFGNKFSYLKNVNQKSNVNVAHRIMRDMRRRRNDPSLQGAALIALYSLAGTPENKKKLFDLGALRLVITAMRTFPKNEYILEAACAAIKAVGGGMYGSLQQGAGDEVLRCMEIYQKNPKIQQVACEAVKALAFCSSYCSNFLKAGVGKLIFNAMINHKTSCGVKTSACGAIWSLCSHSLEGVTSPTGQQETTSSVIETFWRMGLGAKVVIAMKQKSFKKDAKLQENGCGAIRSIGHSFAMMRLGAATVVLDAMKLHQRNIRVIEPGCSIIRKFAALRSNAEWLMKLNAGERIIKSMEDEVFLENATVQKAACLALWNLAFWDVNKIKLMDIGVSEAVLSALTNHSTNASVVETACGVFANLATIQNNAVRLLDMRVHKEIVAAARANPKREQVQVNAVIAVRNLSYFDKTRLLPLAGTLPMLKAAMKAFPKNPYVQSKAKEAINKMKENRV